MKPAILVITLRSQCFDRSNLAEHHRRGRLSLFREALYREESQHQPRPLLAVVMLAPLCHHLHHLQLLRSCLMLILLLPTIVQLFLRLLHLCRQQR